MRKKWIAVLSICAVALAALVTYTAVSRAEKAPVAATLYLYKSVSTGLARIAAKEGYFADEGLTVTIKDFDQGAAAAPEFAKDAGVAFGTGSEIVAADVRRRVKDLKVIAQTTSDDDYFDFVVASDSGQATLHDLRGKRIGVTPMSASRVFALSSLSAQGLEAGKDYTIVELALKDMTAALKAGRIDAHVSREPYSSASVVGLAGKASIVRDPGAYVLLDTVIARQSMMDAHPDVAPALLRAYLRAQDFLQEDPQRGREIIAASLGIAVDKVQESDTDLMDVRLGDQLLSGLDNARAFLSKEQGYPPNDYFVNAREVVDTEPLAAVDPTHLTIG